jgi:hypothetical protein
MLRTRLPESIPLIGVGGILSGADAATKQAAGATLCSCTPAWSTAARHWCANASRRLRRRKEAPAAATCRRKPESPELRIHDRLHPHRPRRPAASRNTFGVAATGRVLVEVSDSSRPARPAADRDFGGQLSLVLGGGSNLLFAGNPDGVVLALTGKRVVRLDPQDTTTTDEKSIVRADAGVEWHDFVMRTLRRVWPDSRISP